MGFSSFPVWWETLWDYFQNKPDCPSILESIFLTLWNIWKARNKEVFKFVPLDPLATSSRISLSRLELQQYGIFAAPPSYTSWCFLRQEVWIPPPHGPLKFNTDAAWNDQFSPASVAVVVYDTFGTLLDGVVKCIWSYSPLVAETCAALETLRLTLLEAQSHLFVLWM